VFLKLFLLSHPFEIPAYATALDLSYHEEKTIAYLGYLGGQSYFIVSKFCNIYAVCQLNGISFEPRFLILCFFSDAQPAYRYPLLYSICPNSDRDKFNVLIEKLLTMKFV